jgi:Nucleotide modification associated domain 3
MNAILIRIGIDQEYGGWNAPVDPVSGRFVYVPIPETQEPLNDLVRSYDEILPTLTSFSFDLHLADGLICTLPANLSGRPMHLDPDFEHLTYGDNGANRGAKLKTFSDGDLLVFYAGLRPVSDNSKRLMYAIVGLFVAEEVVEAIRIPKELWHQNAHTRKRKIGKPDIIVRAKRGKSGRLERAIPIGEWRDRAYRVTNKLLPDWGGLDVKNGFIQRSVSPPSFLKPEKFYKWFLNQRVPLLERNN